MKVSRRSQSPGQRKGPLPISARQGAHTKLYPVHPPVSRRLPNGCDGGLQSCGGHLRLLCRRFPAACLGSRAQLFPRPLTGSHNHPSPAVRRHIRAAQHAGSVLGVRASGRWRQLERIPLLDVHRKDVANFWQRCGSGASSHHHRGPGPVLPLQVGQRGHVIPLQHHFPAGRRRRRPARHPQRSEVPPRLHHSAALHEKGRQRARPPQSRQLLQSFLCPQQVCGHPRAHRRVTTNVTCLLIISGRTEEILVPAEGLPRGSRRLRGTQKLHGSWHSPLRLPQRAAAGGERVQQPRCRP
mmetsp:Transcript_13569/g.41036  ORF Transcript_13569/g.41036 Transcript_13569/m.41036 type:complete len:297 (-) Transcript_13569:841-1731(-)